MRDRWMRTAIDTVFFYREMTLDERVAEHRRMKARDTVDV